MRKSAMENAKKGTGKLHERKIGRQYCRLTAFYGTENKVKVLPFFSG